MEVSISIIRPKIRLAATMESIGNTIIGHFTIITKPSADILVLIDIDCIWSDTDTWERDIRHNLSQIVEEQDILLECHMKGPRYSEATEAERRIRTALSNILGINYR